MTNERSTVDDDDDDDLSQFHGVFYDEAEEHLVAMESLLLAIDIAAPDIEQLNAIFRAAHSIKGGSAMFGFEDIAALTHEMETVFDRVRKGELALSTALIDSFLDAGDTLKAMFAARRSHHQGVPAIEVSNLCTHLRSFLGESTVVAPAAPHETVDVQQPAHAPVAQSHAADEGADFGLFVDPESLAPVATQSTTAAPEHRHPGLRSVPKAAPGHADDDTSIRVSVQKVDQLINLVGELVITQAMLAQTASTSDAVVLEALLNGLSQLQRNTRDLQEAAMSIRMMPMSFAFSRFPRMVRDVAAKLGKDVDLQMIGEGTELDKGLIERIVDPLTHLVRNSLDHGIESPEERVAKGKPRKGNIALRAYHQGGAIVIEVSDDGRGLARDRILAKAKERGLTVSDSMSDQDVWQLIFEAGFSTAEQVTAVSGRGVGMDVVRRNIQEMGGRVEIDSVVDIGTRMRIKLPLTLAILDGMSVRLGGELFIIPLGYISESLQPKLGAVNTLGGRCEVISARGAFLPVLSLADVFNVPADSVRHEDGIMVILEAEEGKTALFVDDLVGQHQVVIKSLETNYRKVAGISGATIMGDGRVAMILDVPYLVGLAHSHMDKAA